MSSCKKRDSCSIAKKSLWWNYLFATITKVYEIHEPFQTLEKTKPQNPIEGMQFFFSRARLAKPYNKIAGRQGVEWELTCLFDIGTVASENASCSPVPSEKSEQGLSGKQDRYEQVLCCVCGSTKNIWTWKNYECRIVPPPTHTHTCKRYMHELIENYCMQLLSVNYM